MTSAVAVVVARVLHREGGIAQVPGESWTTYYGQRPQWLKDWGFKTPRTESEAAANYTRWMQRVRLDALCEIDVELADMVVDYAVHSGHIPAIKLLQRLVGVPADGVIGPVTLGAVTLAPHRHILAVLFGCDRVDFLASWGAAKEHDGKPVDRRDRLRGVIRRVTAQIRRAAVTQETA